MCVCVCVCVCVCGCSTDDAHSNWSVGVCVCVCVWCVCVCVVSGNASGYFISHPWEELHLYVMGFICVHVLGTSASIHSLTC